MGKTLGDVAEDMVWQAKRRSPCVRELSGGLCLDLSIVGGMKVLRLSRPVVLPEADEVSQARLAFGVPMDVEAEVGALTVTLRWPSG